MMTFTLGELAVRFGCSVRGEPDTTVERVGTLRTATDGAISFLANPRYRKYLATTGAAAVIVSAEYVEECPVPALISEDPYALYARVAALLYPPPRFDPGTHASAVVGDNVQQADSAAIGPGAVVEKGCVLGENVYVGPGCVVGANSHLGDGTWLIANVSVGRDVSIGERVLIHPGAVIGSDGFGFARDGTSWLKVPQVGSVVVGNDVEIGACTSIDRGAIDDTVIEDGVKLDNQIQVGHNVRVGAHTIIAACSGISGSTRIGARCMIAGMVGFVGHLEIADDVTVTGLTMVNRSIDSAGVYSGGLAVDNAVRWRKNSARFRQLDDLARRLNKIEQATNIRDRKRKK